MSLPRLAVERPVTTCMLLLSVLLFGAIALTRLPLVYLPELDAPWIHVTIPYPSSNPAQVEREIIKPVEEALSTLSGIKRMHATAGADSGELDLEFNWGQDVDVIRMQVGEKLDQVKSELPDGIGQILIYSFNTSDIPVVEARISADGVDLSESYDLLETRVLNRIRRVPGVARVDLGGVLPKEIYIELSLDAIKQHGVSFDNLVGRLMGATSGLVLGEVRDDGLRYTARALGDFDSIDQLHEMVIDDRGLRLRDVAEVRFEEPAVPYARHLNRQEAIALSVFKESTANTVDVVRAVLTVIEGDIDSDPLLQGVNVFVWENQADEILQALSGVTRAGMLGALLAVVVLYIFLRRLGATLIVALTIPFSVIAACGVMYFLGMTLNILSMTGLMLGVGMLVDNAIVVLESIERRGRQEPDKRRAARLGAGQVAMAVTASTLTTLIVFLPLIVGSKTELTTWLGELGMAICLALVCSLVSSLALIPMVSARFLKTGSTDSKRHLEGLERAYGRLLRWTLTHRWKTAGILALALVLGYLPLAAEWVDKSQFSGAVNERLYIEYDFLDFAYRSRVREVVEQVEDLLFVHQEELLVESVYSYYQSNMAVTTMTLARQDLDDRAFRALRRQVRQKLPEIPGVRFHFGGDGQDDNTTTFTVNFFGQDGVILDRLAREATRRLETVGGVADVARGGAEPRREIEVKIDRQKAASLGLTAQEVSDVFGFTLGGMRLPRIKTGGREVETWLALRLEDRESLTDLAELPFRQVDGRPVTLGDIASFQVVDRPRQIQHQDRKVRAYVRASYEGEDWEDTKEEIKGLMDALDIPAGYAWSWGNFILEQENQDEQMKVNFILALILVYLVMASLFESLAQPLAILTSIAFAPPGVYWLLWITDTPFNLMAMIGLLILIGIVVNNGIVLLDHVNRLRRSGLPRDEAIVRAGQDRMRAILMTATTTICGLLPLAIGGSKVGGLFYYPLALTVMGGLVSSAAMTLLVLPYINLLVEGAAGWLRGLWLASGTEQTGEAVKAGAG